MPTRCAAAIICKPQQGMKGRLPSAAYISPMMMFPCSSLLCFQSMEVAARIATHIESAEKHICLLPPSAHCTPVLLGVTSTMFSPCTARACSGPASKEIAHSLHMLFGGIDLDPSGKEWGLDRRSRDPDDSACSPGLHAPYVQ